MGILKKANDWYIDYYAHGRRKREKIGPNKKLAESVLAKRKLAIAENRFLDVKKASKTTFYELCDLYIELHARPNKRHWKRSDLLHQRRLKEFFGNVRLHTITQEQVEQYKAKRLGLVSPATVNRELSCLKHMFNKAVEWGKTDSNPAGKVKKFRENNSRLRYLEREEIRKLIDNCNAILRPVVMVAIYTGMRQGEILGLKWRDVDLGKGIIYVLRTKNNEPREVPMCGIVKEALLGLLRRRFAPPRNDGTMDSCFRRNDREQVRNSGEGHVFCKKNGKPYGKLRKSFLQALEKSGILNFRFHDLRHTFASHLVMSGVDLNTVRELLGHKDIKMTLRYSHLSRDHKRRAMENFGREMDTIWTPEAKSAVFDKFGILHKSLEHKELV